MRVGGGLACEGRAGENVALRIRPHRMVHHIEGLESKLQPVMLAERHPEFLVRLEIEGEEPGSDQRISSHISPAPRGGLYERRRIVPARWSRIGHIRTDAGGD